MTRLSLGRRLLKFIHPEGIPWPGSVFYNSISTTGVFQRHYELIAKDIMNYSASGSLLDVGTGPGWLLLKLHQQSPEMRLVGLDVSRSMVAKARQNMADAGVSDIIAVREGNVRELPFTDHSFDIIVSTGSIHHWKEPGVGLDEIYRVLKPGGRALIYDVVSDTPSAALAEIRREFGRLKMVMFWLHCFEEPFYSRENFELLAKTTLFKQGKTKFVGVFCCLMLKKEL